MAPDLEKARVREIGIHTNKLKYVECQSLHKV